MSFGVYGTTTEVCFAVFSLVIFMQILARMLAWICIFYCQKTAVDALQNLMIRYAGTIVFITHDVLLLKNVADVVYEIEQQKIIRKT